jgi:PAS domain S-box-containing protein
VNTRGSPLPARYDTSPLPRTRFSLSNLPLRHRLPLLIGILLFGIMTLSIWASYRGVRESALEVGDERLRSLTQQLANQVQQSLPIFLNRTFTAANDPAVRTFLTTPSPNTRPAAVAILQQFASAQDPSSLQVELWNSTGSLVLAVPDNSSPESADLSVEFKQSGVDPYKTVGPLRVVKGVVIYPVVAAVKDEQGKVIGFLVRWRGVSPTPNARKQIADLLGSHAALYYGNTQGDIFTDLEKIVPKPPVGLGSTLEVTHYIRDGNSVMALGRPIAGTPWFVVVEFPDQVFLTQANRFLRKMLLVGSGLFVVGLGSALVLTRNITGPLHSLTRAASAIGGGDYSPITAVRQNDELGALAHAFNVMVVELRDSQRELERKASLFEHTYDAVLVWDWNGPITFWNRGAERVYGFANVDALGKSPHELLRTELAGGVDSLIHSLERNGQWEGELEHTTRAGSQIIIESRMVLVRQPAGAYVIEIARDITERKLAEAAQRASELRYRRLFESAKDGILILNADTGQIIDANPYIIKTLGYSYEELMGKELWQIGVFKDIAAARESFEELRDKGYVRYDDLPLETHGGVKIDVEFVSNVYPVGDTKVIQCNIRDITEPLLGKRALEESNHKLETTLSELSATTQQLWQASKLATMGELSASVAHELNNPLATVALRVENILMTMTADEQQRHSLEVISQEVDRMASLVENLLEFSRRTKRQISTVDAREEINKSVDFVHYHLRSRQVEVIRDFANSLPTIQADCQQLRQVFLNLLTNASDAMPEGGVLTVRVRTGVLQKDEAVQIDFTDTGEGIPAENLKKIWDSFFTTKSEGKGTGLGLAICRRIVEEHDGTIEIESEVGRGTTVRILFPATVSGAGADFS